jgi:hypothetical protein
LRRAVATATELGNPGLKFAAAGAAVARLNALHDRTLLESIAREVRDWPREGARALDLAQCLYYGGVVLLECGDRSSAEAMWRELEQLAERTRDASVGMLALYGPIAITVVDGRLEEAVSLADALRDRGKELGISVGEALPVRALSYLGRLNVQTLDGFEGTSRPWLAARAHFLAELGHHDQARAIREQFAGIESEDDESASHILVSLLAAANFCGDLETLSLLIPRLAPLADRLFLSGVDHPGSVGRLLGSATTLLGEEAQARAHFETALGACERIHHRPELALTRLGLAELLLTGSSTDQAEAQAFLDAAIDELQAMKMQPSLERALRHKGLLHA